MSARDLVIGSFNPGKVGEVRDAFKDLSLTVRYLREFSDVLLVAETGQTYAENAILKAQGYAKQTRVLTLADDSGLEVDALDGRPGVFSARFGGPDASDHDRLNLLLEELADKTPPERTARFVCCMALAGWVFDGKSKSVLRVLTVVEGKCEGIIANAPAGANGFGFDPVFIPKGYTQTFAELPNEVKARISHRAKALTQIRAFLSEGISVA
jgi:XTP/dITP diphosphohydrolase